MIAKIEIGTYFSSICMLNKEGEADPVKVSTGMGMFRRDYFHPSPVFIISVQLKLG